MNFHKTIGFLATLLLTLGLGVPDSYAQTNPATGVTIAFAPAISATEGGAPVAVTLTVTATLTNNLDTGSNRAVALGLATGSTMVGTFTPPLPSSVNVVGDGTPTGTFTGNYVYTPPAEDDGIGTRDFDLQASIDDQTATVTVGVPNSGGTTVSAITIELNGETAVTATEGGDALAITVVVDALVGTDAEAGYTRPVVVSHTPDGTNPLAGKFSVEFPITVNARVTAATLAADAADADTARAMTTITYTPAAEDNAEIADGVGTLAATSPFGGQDAALTSANVTVTETDINIISAVAVTLNGGANVDVAEDAAPIGVIMGVSITFDGTREEGETRDVVVDLASGSTLQGRFSRMLPITVTATVPDGGGTGATGQVVLTYTPEPDANTTPTTVTLTPSTAGQDGTGDGADGTTTVTPATLTLTDDDIVSSVDLQLNGDDALAVDESDGETEVVLSATVAFSEDQTATDTHVVVVDLAPGSTLAGTFDPALPATVTTTVDAADLDAATGGDVTVTYTPPTDPDSTDPAPFDLRASIENQTDDATVTVTDDSESAGRITITVNPTEIRENIRARDVMVTAELSQGTGPVTVMVTTEVMGQEQTGMETPEPTGTITIPAGETSGSTTLSLDPTDDNVFTTRTIMVTGTAEDQGYEAGTASIKVLDDDTSIGTLSISAASPPSVTQGSGAQMVTLTVRGALKDKEEETGTVVVTVTTDKGMFPNNAMSAMVTVSMKDNVDLVPDSTAPVGTAKINLSLAAADVASEGTITVNVSADMYDSGSRNIPIRDRDAEDVVGYRVVIANKSDGQWLPIGNNRVDVHVIRVGAVAYPWTDFDKIQVSLRDTLKNSEYDIDYVAAQGFNLEDDGALTFTKVFKPHGTRSDNIVANEGDVKYLGNDTLNFRVGVNAKGSDNPAESDERDNGQYLGVYAHVKFYIGSTVSGEISSRHSDKAVYPSNPTLVDEANRYVGDGKLVKVDNLKPGNAAITTVRVTSGDEVNAAINAKVGDAIRVAVKVSGNILFRESGIRIQLQPRDGMWKVRGQALDSDANDSAPVTKTQNFSAAQVIASTSDSLRHTWKITEGFFQFKTDDYIEGVGAKGVVFEADDTQARVLVAVKDQAGNWSGSKTVGWFKADSRSPQVSILYPSANPDSLYDHMHPLRFTGKVLDLVEGENVDAHLNPLAIFVDEDLSKLEVFAVGADTLNLDFSASRVADSTAVYDTSDLSSPKKDEDDKYPDAKFVPSSANIAGTEIELAVLATDLLGNTTKATIAGVTHDAARPVLKEWFPKSSLLQDDQFNDATPPVFTLPEDVDSIAVRFTGSGGNDVAKGRGGVTPKGEDSFDFSGELKDEIAYEMTIFVRDLAGNVFITPADSSSNMRFNAEFDNPVATRYNITTTTADMDSVIAGQANMLTIQAEDHDASSNTTRKALTYKNKVRISAWDYDGGAAESVWFEGTGVDDDADNPDGEAMLSAADWRIGKRTVAVKSNKATGFIKILVQHLDSGMGDTAVMGFESAIDSLYVGAADFAGFEITAWEEGVEGPAPEIWGDYTLRVVPVDRHGNPSVRAFKMDPKTAEDSLNVLDTRVKDNAFEYKNGIDVGIVGVPTIEDFALLTLTIEPGGSSYDLVAPADRRSQTVQVKVENESLMDNDDRSQNRRSTEKFKISAPLTPALTLWVPGSDMDEAGNDVSIPADPGNITVTVRAEGFNAGDMVTFTRNGEDAGTEEADGDGNAPLMITASMAGTTTVSATNGVYSTDELTITFVEGPVAPARKSYVDAEGNPVYLIYAGDAPSDMTVGVDDFLALVAAFGSSDGDDNYNAQADVDDGGDVGVADFLEFLTSWGRTAVGPATKPLVLLPGINENAEFSLSLGSERVVAGELVAVDVSLANVAALIGYGFALNYETDKFEFVSVAPADEDLLKSTGGETLFHHVVADGQVTVANGLYNGTAVSGGGDVVQFVFRVLREFEDNARFEIADGLVFDPSQLQNPAVVAGVLELQSTPREFALHQNFPNPFNPDTTIKYDLAESADVTLQIYNVLGQVVRTLVASEAQNAGRYQIRWNGMDDRGVPVSSGIYFYQISADGKFSDVRKLMLLK